MTLSVWRYAHLALAIFSSLFLVLASLTGVILAVDAVQEQLPSYRVDQFDTITLAETLDSLQQAYPEIINLSVTHNEFVLLEGIDQKGNDVNAYVNPLTGEIIGQPQQKSDFVQWTTALHRSLFLKETGRIFIGFISFLLTIIAASGMVLIIQRQQGLIRFFSRIIKDDWAQFYHVITGRLMLIPILIIALSGTYLSLVKLNLWPQAVNEKSFTAEEATHTEAKKVTAFTIFQQTTLPQVRSIEFPFSPDDPEEFFILKLKDRELTINQFNGDVVHEKIYPITTLLETLSLNLHTGRTSIIWAIVLGIASLNILFFIYSGFTITWKRSRTRINNKYKADDCNFIILVGSENGNTLRVANALHQQLLAHQQTSYLTELNNYICFPKAQHILVFTSTHGLGVAPSNATRFVSRLAKFKQNEKVQFSVIGFGSKAYPDFCGFAKQVDTALSQQSWAQSFLPLHTINDKSPEEVIAWVKLWSAKIQLPLATTPAVYSSVPHDVEKMTVLHKTVVTETDRTFILTLKTRLFTSFASGDLLAVYPDGKERLYSVGKSNGNIQLVVKLHADGLGSNYLYHLEAGAVIQARLIRNNAFHFPKQSPAVMMIANGTGIAPFLGMIEQNKTKSEIYLYAGFRKETDSVKHYSQLLQLHTQNQHLKKFHFAFSREENPHYVMDLIREDSNLFVNLLEIGGTVMICGSLAMQQDVEILLDRILHDKTGKGLQHYKDLGQVLADCY